MIFPSGSAIRTVDRSGDLDAVRGLLAACDLEDVGEPDGLDVLVAEAWRGEALQGAWLVLDDRGEPAAYVELETADPASSFDSYCPVHPRHRVGPLRREILRFLIDRAVDRATGPDVVLRTSASAGEPGFAADAEAVGFRQVRVFWHMVGALDPSEGPGDPPEGVTIRTARDPQDDPAIHAVLDGAFRGHFGLEPMTFERFVAEFKDDRYDASLVAIAEEAGEPVGVAAGWDVDGLGWIGDLGVLPEARGRGIGAALLRTAFALLAARGLTRVRLNVDSGNETGATRLYERVGMTVHRAFDVYETTLPAG